MDIYNKQSNWYFQLGEIYHNSEYFPNAAIYNINELLPSAAFLAETFVDMMTPVYSPPKFDKVDSGFIENYEKKYNIKQL